MQLYSYFRSSAAYRVRIALNLKGLDYSIVPVNLVEGEQRKEDYRTVNPQGLVPALVLDSGETLSQSLAILEWLEESHSGTSLYPEDALERAQYRADCLHIACDIHPLNNLRILKYLSGELKLEQTQIDDWYSRWIQIGFGPLEERVAARTDAFSLGARPGMFEVLLIPQMYNAKRFNVDLSAFPALLDLDARCAAMSEFSSAHPSVQPDTPEAERA